MWNFSHESNDHRVTESKSSSRSTCIVPETNRCWSREDCGNRSHHGRGGSSLHYLPTQPSPSPAPAPAGREWINTGTTTGAFSVASTRSSPSVPLPTSTYLHHHPNTSTGIHVEGADYKQNVTKIANNNNAKHDRVTLLKVSASPPSHSPSPSPEPAAQDSGPSFPLEKKHYHSAPPPPMTAEEAVGRKKADIARHMDPLSQLLALGSGSITSARGEPNFRPKPSPSRKVGTHLQHGYNYTNGQGSANTTKTSFYNKEEDDDGERRREDDYSRGRSPSMTHAVPAAGKGFAVKDFSIKSYMYPSPWGPMRAYVRPSHDQRDDQNNNPHSTTAVAPTSAWGCAFSAPMEKVSVASNTYSGEAFNDDQKRCQTFSTPYEEEEGVRGVPRFSRCSTKRDEGAAFAKIPVTVSLRRTPQFVDKSSAVGGGANWFTTPARSCSGGGVHEYRDRSRTSPDQTSPSISSRLRVASITTKETPNKYVGTDRQQATSTQNSLILSSNKESDNKTKALHTPRREAREINPHLKSADPVASTPASTPRYLSNTTTSSAKTRTRSPATTRQVASRNSITNSNASKAPASNTIFSKASVRSGRGAAGGGGNQKLTTDSFAAHCDGGRSPSVRTSTSHVMKQLSASTSLTQQSRLPGSTPPTSSNASTSEAINQTTPAIVVDHNRRTSTVKQSTTPAASHSRGSSPSFFSGSSFSERVLGLGGTTPSTPSVSMVPPRETTVSAGEVDVGMGWACPVCAALVFGHLRTEASTRRSRQVEDIDHRLSTSRSPSAAAHVHVGAETTHAVSAAVPLTELFAHTVRCLASRRALEAFLLKDTFGIVGGRSWGLAEGTDTVEKIVEAIHKKLIRVTRERREGKGRGEEMGGRGVAGGTPAGDGWITNSGEDSRRASVFVVPHGAVGGGTLRGSSDLIMRRQSDADSVCLVDKDATLVFRDVSDTTENGGDRVRTNFSDENTKVRSAEGEESWLRGGSANERDLADHHRRYSVEEVSSTTSSQQILPTKEIYARRISAIREEYNGIARLCATSIGGVLCPMDGGGLFAADIDYTRRDVGGGLGEVFEARNGVDTAASLEHLFSRMCCSAGPAQGASSASPSSGFPSACCVNFGVMSMVHAFRSSCSHSEFAGANDAASRSRRGSVESSQGAVIQGYSYIGTNPRFGFCDATPPHVNSGSRSSSQGPDVVSDDISLEAQIEALRRLALSPSPSHPYGMSVSKNSDSRTVRRAAQPLIFSGGDAAFEKRIRKMATKRLEVLSRYTSSHPYDHRRTTSTPIAKMGSAVPRTSGDRGQRIPRLTIPLELSSFVQHALACWSCEVVIVYQGELVGRGWGGMSSRTPSRPPSPSSAPRDQSQRKSEKNGKEETAPFLRYISVRVVFLDVCDSLSRRLESAAAQERQQTSSFCVASSDSESSPASKRRPEERRGGGGGVDCHDGDCSSESSMASALHVAARDLVSFVRGLPAVSERRVRVPTTQLAGGNVEEESKPLLPQNEEEPQLYRCEVLSPPSTAHSPHFLSSGADVEGLGLVGSLARAFRLRRLPPSVSLLRFFEPFLVLCPQGLTDELHRVFAEVTARSRERSRPRGEKEKEKGGESSGSQAYSSQRRPLWAD